MIAETIALLLSHYGSSDMHPALRAGQARDWVDDLTEFPASIVKEAVKQFRQSAAAQFRPKPIDIRMLCVEQQRAAAPKPLQLAPPPEKQVKRWHEMTPEEQQEHEALMAKFREIMPEANSVTRYRSDGIPRAPGPIVTHPLPDVDDPEVQKVMKRMGE